MHDAWTDRLSDYIDGLLDPADERELKAHVDTCAQCRDIEAELRRVIATAQTTRTAELSLPARDLWPDIAAAIAGGRPGRASAGIDHTASDIRPRRGPSTARNRNRFSFSMPQLAAAAMLLVTISAATAWFISETRQPEVMGTIVQSAGAPGDASVRTVALQPVQEYTDDIAELESALEQFRDQLDPTTIEVIERSLDAINGAIADARNALETDPGNANLHRQLDNTLRKKVDLLRRATRVQRGEI